MKKEKIKTDLIKDEENLLKFPKSDKTTAKTKTESQNNFPLCECCCGDHDAENCAEMRNLLAKSVSPERNFNELCCGIVARSHEISYIEHFLPGVCPFCSKKHFHFCSLLSKETAFCSNCASVDHTFRDCKEVKPSLTISGFFRMAQSKDCKTVHCPDSLVKSDEKEKICETIKNHVLSNPDYREFAADDNCKVETNPDGFYKRQTKRKNFYMNRFNMPLITERNCGDLRESSSVFLYRKENKEHQNKKVKVFETKNMRSCFAKSKRVSESGSRYNESLQSNAGGNTDYGEKATLPLFKKRDYSSEEPNTVADNFVKTVKIDKATGKAKYENCVKEQEGIQNRNKEPEATKTEPESTNDNEEKFAALKFEEIKDTRNSYKKSLYEMLANKCLKN